LAIIIDTGVFYSFFDTKDEYYLDSVALLSHCVEGKYGRPFTTDYVELEVTTLLQRRLGADVSLAFLDFIRDNRIDVFTVSAGYYESVLATFRKEFKRLSFCDSGTVVAMNELTISLLASYDRRSFTDLVGEMLGVGYFKSLTEAEQSAVRKSIGKVKPGAVSRLVREDRDS